MTTVAVVQARTGSSRLPGKVLMDLAGRPMIDWVIERAGRAATIDEVVLATSDAVGDDELVDVARRLGVRCHRGSELDVLRRFRDAARAADADAIVRITADCPLVAPDVIDRVAGNLTDRAEEFDLVSNVLERSYPKGLDAEALHRDVLERLDRMGHSAEAREHVTWFAYRERPELFSLHSIEHGEDFSALNWSVDTAEDLERARELYARFDLDSADVPWARIAAET